MVIHESIEAADKEGTLNNYYNNQPTIDPLGSMDNFYGEFKNPKESKDTKVQSAEVKNPKIDGTKSTESIQESMAENLGLNDTDFQKEFLNNKEKHKKQATDMLFSKGQIDFYAQSTEITDLNTLAEHVGEAPGDEDLNNILENFILANDDPSLSNQDLTVVYDALVNAFDLSVAEIIKGKVNYKTESVDVWRKEILSPETNPLEKLYLFKQIKSEVNTSVGSIAKKTANLKKSSQVSQGEERLTKIKEEYTKASTNSEKEKLQVEYKKLKAEIQFDRAVNPLSVTGDLNIGGGKLDTNIEKAQKSA